MSLIEMVSRHPQVDDPNTTLIEAGRHAMLCSLFCTSCADACLAEDMDMAQCIRDCLDCSTICAATAQISVRRTAQNIDVLRSQLQACIQACEICAAECDQHDNPHCELCAKMCRECADDCRKALPTVN